MFVTDRIKIYKQGSDRKLQIVYENVKAQIEKKTVKLDGSISENTLKEIAVVLIDSKYIDVRGGYIIKYIDSFKVEQKLKITGQPEMIKSLYFKKLIELKCDLL